jgi:hypothetical protein
LGSHLGGRALGTAHADQGRSQFVEVGRHSRKGCGRPSRRPPAGNREGGITSLSRRGRS